MLTSINPLVERARRRRWGETVLAYFVGSLLGGLAVGAGLGGLGGLARDLLGALGALSEPTAPAGRLGPAQYGLAIGLVVLGVLGGLLEAAGRVPTRRRQVDEEWLTRYRGWVYGAGFGLQLGAGVATTVTTGAVYLVGVFAVVVASPALGGLIGAVFGLARALPILLGARIEDAVALRSLVRRLAAWETAGRRVTAVSLVVAGAVGAALVLR